MDLGRRNEDRSSRHCPTQGSGHWSVDRFAPRRPLPPGHCFDSETVGNWLERFLFCPGLLLSKQLSHDRRRLSNRIWHFRRRDNSELVPRRLCDRRGRRLLTARRGDFEHGRSGLLSAHCLKRLCRSRGSGRSLLGSLRRTVKSEQHSSRLRKAVQVSVNQIENMNILHALLVYCVAAPSQLYTRQFHHRN
jgi:hypothetical protein